MRSVAEAIRAALLTGVPRDKVMATRALVRAWRRGEFAWDFSAPMPDRPRWPAELELLPPNRMPKRGRGGSERNAVALWHSLAHIEFAAIDLALDMAGRFGEQMGQPFVDDFLSVAADEAMHFALIARKLRSLDAHYGMLPAHDGLWEAAATTRHDVAARLAIVPMVLEARGLDVTPATRARVLASGARIASFQGHAEAAIQRLGASRSRFVAGLLRRGCLINILHLTTPRRETAGGSDHLSKICMNRARVPGRMDGKLA